MSGAPQPGKQMWENKNGKRDLFDKPLHQFSVSPMTGAFRDGFCRSGNDDPGNHSVAGYLSQEFLDFTESKGNNLKANGLKAGQKWCLCASRWKEAMQAAQSAKDPVVPKVAMHATGHSALDVVSYDDLKRFAAEGETGGSQSGRMPRGMAGVPKRQTVHEMNKTGGFAKDQHIDMDDNADNPLLKPEPKNHG